MTARGPSRTLNTGHEVVGVLSFGCSIDHAYCNFSYLISRHTAISLRFHPQPFREASTISAVSGRGNLSASRDRFANRKSGPERSQRRFLVPVRGPGGLRSALPELRLWRGRQRRRNRNSVRRL